MNALKLLGDQVVAFASRITRGVFIKESIIVRCPQCGIKSRIPADRKGEQYICEKCAARLASGQQYPDGLVDVSDWTFTAEVITFPGPVLVEFMLPW
jgi:predicted RNA-binding Zn-ribbon protein involved in translation (DUF1610 family)